ncbi:MAG: hypothetical protein FJ398_23745 [Verrucomicrobia bacterium]|nr:hypothetical protein [Verrucomicrobiota bacterium]
MKTTLTASERKNFNHVIGDSDLCAWRPVSGVVWVQTRNPKHAVRLAQRRDSHLVVRGMGGGYLKTFEFTGKTLAWAWRLIRRYKASQTPALASTGTGVKLENLATA